MCYRVHFCNVIYLYVYLFICVNSMFIINLYTHAYILFVIWLFVICYTVLYLCYVCYIHFEWYVLLLLLHSQYIFVVAILSIMLHNVCVFPITILQWADLYVCQHNIHLYKIQMCLKHFHFVDICFLQIQNVQLVHDEK